MVEYYKSQLDTVFHALGDATRRRMLAQLAKGETEEDAKATWEHVARSPNCSMQKAERLLNFRPRFSSLQAVQESVTWLRQNGEL